MGLTGGVDGRVIDGKGVDEIGFVRFLDKYGTGESGGLDSSSEDSLSRRKKSKRKLN